MQDSDFQNLATTRGRAGDEHLHVRFFNAPMQDEKASKEAGRPIFRDVPHVEILIPGDPYNQFRTEAWIDENDKNSHSRRFPKQYEAFLKGQSGEAVVGTPIDRLPGITGAQVEELKHFKVRTVEGLANISDALLQNFMGGHALKQRAQAWLSAAAGNAPLEAARAELEAERTARKALEERMAALEALALEQPKRGPGRPPKSAE